MTNEEGFEATLRPRITDQQERLARLLASRGKRFTPPKYLRSGGVRDIYTTNYGPAGEREAVAKVERTDVESPRARRHLERGCTTENEIRQVIGLNVPGIPGMIEYFSPEETAKYGITGAVIVEERLKAISLEEWVSQKGPLKGRQLRQFVREYAAIMHNVRERGVLHRDHKSSNVLLEEDRKGNLRVYVIDWANAARVNELKLSVWPTGGGHEATYPGIMPMFTPTTEGETSTELRYDDRCEIYGIAHNIAIAAVGRPLVEYDPDRATAIERDTGRSILTNGKRDPDKHESAIRRGTKKMPASLRALVKEGMSIQKYGGYQNLENFAFNAQHAAHEPATWLQRSKWAGLAAAVALAIGGTSFAIHQASKANEKTQETERRYEFRKKAEMIREYLGNERRNTVESILEGREVRAWVETLGDEKAGFAAYFNPEVTYEAVQRSGGRTDWESIKEQVKGLDFSIYCQLEFSTPGESIDNWMYQGSTETENRVKEKWAETGKRYEAKQAAKQKPQGTTWGSGTGISPIDFNGLKPLTTQPATNPSDHYPAPRNR